MPGPEMGYAVCEAQLLAKLGAFAPGGTWFAE